MKRFVKAILKTLGLLLLINVVLDFVFTQSLNKSRCNLYNEWNHIIHDTIESDLVIIGSSRAWAQYDTRIIDSILSVNSYNLGINGGSVNRQFVKYKTYCHFQKKKPYFIIINFDYWSDWEVIRFQREQYFPYLVNPFMRSLIIEQEPFNIMERYIPMYRYYSQGIVTLLQESRGIEKTYKGYNAHDLKWNGEEFAKVESILFKPDKQLVDQFDCFLSDLRKDRTKVILVSSPIYSGVTKKTKNLSAFYDFRNYFSKKYNIPTLDYISDPICDDTTYFYNATHLNKKGAELFTKKLCHDLDSLDLIINNKE